MKMPGAIRRMERKTGRSVAGRESPRFVFPTGTAQPGRGIQLPGPGFLFSTADPRFFCTIPRSISRESHVPSLFVPQERKSYLEAARRQFHE